MLKNYIKNAWTFKPQYKVQPFCGAPQPTARQLTERREIDRGGNKRDRVEIKLFIIRKFTVLSEVNIQNINFFVIKWYQYCFHSGMKLDLRGKILRTLTHIWMATLKAYHLHPFLKCFKQLATFFFIDRWYSGCFCLKKSLHNNMPHQMSNAIYNGFFKVQWPGKWTIFYMVCLLPYHLFGVAFWL